MDSRKTQSAFSVQGRIEKKIHSREKLCEEVDNFDELSETEKLNVVREVEPETEEVVYNVTTDRLHEYFVDNLDRDQTATEDNVDISWLALGDDASSGTLTSDTDLNNRLYEETITDVADNGKEILTSTFVDSTEANGNTFNEIGLFTGDPANLSNSEVFMINHATFSDITKDNTKTVTFDVTLTFSDV